MNITPKKWDHASASQIKTFRACNRKWWWNKIVGLDTPSTPAMELGTRMHKLLEIYLAGGPAPAATTREGCAALPGLRFLPPPAMVQKINIERKFRLTLQGAAAPVDGFIDLVEPDAVDEVGAWLPMVTDHKSSSNFKYMKEEEELANDAQALLYLAEMRNVLKAEGRQLPESMAFRHVYYLTDKKAKPKAAESKVVLTQAQIDNGCANLVKTINQMHALSTVVDARQVEMNRAECSAYGGCPFQNQCVRAQAPGASALQAAVSFSKKDKTTMSDQPNMTLAERIAARKAQQNGGAAAPAAVAVAATTIATPAQTTPVAPAAQQPATTADLRAQALAAVTDTKPLTPDQPPTQEALDKMKAMGTGQVPYAPVVGINPADGFPADEPGVLEDKARKAPACLPDGRVISKLSKDDLKQTHAELTSTVHALGKLAIYLQKAAPEFAAWVQASNYGEKVPGKKEGLVVDVELLAAIVMDKPLPKLAAPVDVTVTVTHVGLVPSDALQDKLTVIKDEKQKLVGSSDPVALAQMAEEQALTNCTRANAVVEKTQRDLADARAKAAAGDEEAEEQVPALRKAEKAAVAAREEAQAAYKWAQDTTIVAKKVAEEKASQLVKSPLTVQKAPDVAGAPSQQYIGVECRCKELYVNAAPRARHGDPLATYLENFIHPIQQQVAQDRGVEHYLLLDFNQGPKLVAAQLAFAVSRSQIELPQRLICLRTVMGDPVVAALALLYGEMGGLVVEHAG